MNLHYYLTCPRLHDIPIPRSSLRGTGANLPAKATNERRATIACPECGLVYVYYESYVQSAISPRLDPFDAGERLLVGLLVECDHKSRDTPMTVHTIVGVDMETWQPKVFPKDWTFPVGMRCESGHHMQPRSQWTDYVNQARVTYDLWE
jgi:hypothetical protein